MSLKVSEMLYVSLAILRLRLIDQLICILSFHAESCLLLNTHLKTQRQRVGADAAGRSREVAELLRRRFRQEWSEASEFVAEVPVSGVTVYHRAAEKLPLE